jgi:hypothetical protein
MQPVFALASIAGMLSSGQRKEVPMPGNQRGDRGRPRPTPGTVDIGADITVNRLRFVAMRITG